MINKNARSTSLIFRVLSPVFCTMLMMGFLSGSTMLRQATTVAAGPAPQGSPSIVGQWSAPEDWGVVVIHSHVLPNGKLLFWSRDKTPQGGDVLGSTQARIDWRFCRQRRTLGHSARR
jgi:hypothetical protein